MKRSGIPVRVSCGDIRLMTPLAAQVMMNEINSHRQKGRKRQEFCKRGHRLEGDNVRLYRHAGRIEFQRMCYACALERKRKQKPRKC